MQTQRKTFRLGCRPAKQGPRPLSSNQGRVEKSVTGSTMMKNTTILSQCHAKQLQLRNKLRLDWTDNITTWTGLPVEESVRMTQDGDGESTSTVWCGMASTLVKQIQGKAHRPRKGMETHLTMAMFFPEHLERSSRYLPWPNQIIRAPMGV